MLDFYTEVFFVSDAEDCTQGFLHTRQALCNWATTLALHSILELLKAHVQVTTYIIQTEHSTVIQMLDTTSTLSTSEKSMGKHNRCV
jgi:hypothetical protein